MAKLSSRNLTLWALRSHLKGLVAFGLVAAIWSMITGPSWREAAKDFPGGMSQLAATGAPISKELSFLTGPVDHIDTVSGYVSYKIFPTLAIILAIYAAIQGARVLRGSEDRGLLDLWFATGKTRAAIVVDRFGAFMVVVACLVFLLFLGTGIGGVIAEEPNWAGAFGQSVDVGMVMVFSFAFAFFVSQFCNAARTAAGIASGYMVASFFLANISDSIGAFSVLKFASPFFYYLQARTLVPGNSFDLAAMGTLLAASAVLVLLGVRLLSARDIGGVSLSSWRKARTESYVFQPGRFWRRWLWTNWIVEQRVGLFFWCLGIAFFSALETAVVPQALSLLKGSKGLGKFSRAGLTLDSAHYLSFLFSFTAIVVAGFAAAQVGRWVSDAIQHRNDAILVQPISMGDFVAERWLHLVGATAIVVAAGLLGTGVGALVGGVALDGAGLVRVTGDLLLLALATGGVGMGATMAFRSGLATAIAVGMILLSVLLPAVAGVFKWPDWTLRPSLFDAFGTPYVSMPNGWSLAYLFGLGLGGFLLAFVAMKRGARVAL
jgi:ABC-2 type transport system permease protein